MDGEVCYCHSNGKQYVMLRICWVTTNSQYDSNAKLESGTLKINLKCQRILISINCVTERSSSVINDKSTGQKFNIQ